VDDRSRGGGCHFQEAWFYVFAFLDLPVSHEFLDERFVDDDVDSFEPRDRFYSEVVWSGAKAAGRDDDACFSCNGIAEDTDHVLNIIVEDHDSPDLSPESGNLLRHPKCVRILYLSHQKFSSDRIQLYTRQVAHDFASSGLMMMSVLTVSRAAETVAKPLPDSARG